MHAQAMCRAHIVAQGGNALTSFRLKVSLLFKHTQYIHQVALLKQPLFCFEHLPGVQNLCYINHFVSEGK